MGQVNHKKLFTLILLFFLTGVLIYLKPAPVQNRNNISLNDYLSVIGDWKRISAGTLSNDIVDALELDDYINNKYSKGNAAVSLYIGYYYTSSKVGAAHSPLVCYPGQGWIISGTENRPIIINDENIHYKSMIVSLGETKELLLYWYQSDKKTSQGTLMQKIRTLISKTFKGKENNAFVRVTIPLNGTTIDDAYSIGIDFIQEFYPNFLKYMS